MMAETIRKYLIGLEYIGNDAFKNGVLRHRGKLKILARSSYKFSQQKDLENFYCVAIHNSSSSNLLLS